MENTLMKGYEAARRFLLFIIAMLLSGYIAIEFFPERIEILLRWMFDYGGIKAWVVFALFLIGEWIYRNYSEYGGSHEHSTRGKQMLTPLLLKLGTDDSQNKLRKQRRNWRYSYVLGWLFVAFALLVILYQLVVLFRPPCNIGMDFSERRFGWSLIALPMFYLIIWGAGLHGWLKRRI